MNAGIPATSRALLVLNSIFVLVASKGLKPAVAPPFQRNAVNPSHCARFVFLSRAIGKTDSPSYVAQAGHREPHVPPLTESHRGLPALSFQLFRCLLDISPQLLGLGGRTCAAAAASEAPAVSSVSASYSAPSRSTSPAGPCVDARGGAAAAAAVDKPSRSIASPSAACAAGRDNRACSLLSPS